MLKPRCRLSAVVAWHAHLLLQLHCLVIYLLLSQAALEAGQFCTSPFTCNQQAFQLVPATHASSHDIQKILAAGPFALPLQ